MTPNRVVKYEYSDGSGNLTDVIDVNGGDTHYVYDSAHRMTAMFDPKCFATPGCPGITNTYNGAGQVAEPGDQLGRTTTLLCRRPGQCGGQHDDDHRPCGQRESGDLSVRGSGARHGRVRDSEAATTYYRYDPATGQLIFVVDPDGNQTSMSYDSSGNMLTKTDPLGRADTVDVQQLQ